MAEEPLRGSFRAYPNSGLESLAAEASRRTESLENECDPRDREPESEPKSPTSKGKVRKAYTITKQRERWTEEEHDRFLQALKRYGRAWRKIEEHIGTKTAVQIRSHAQKFFSKLQREQSMNGGRDESSKNEINIPPPRPKRKPMHPYPRNSIDSQSEPHEQLRSTRHQPNAPSKLRDSEATASTQVPNSNQYSNSSGHQQAQIPSQPHPLYTGHTPFSGAFFCIGAILSPQPSQVQLPPFPSLDTSGGENLTKVLKDAALAAASAWNSVISVASPKVQHLIQTQSFHPSGMHNVPPMWTSSQYLDMEQNPFMRQLLFQAAQQHNNSHQVQNPHEPSSSRHGQPIYARQASTNTLGSHQQDPLNNTTAPFQQGARNGSHQQKVEINKGDSDKDSACSKEDARPKFSNSAFNSTQAPAYWSSKAPYGLTEAKLGRSAWEMMNRVTAQKSRELSAKAKTEDLPRPKLMEAPSTGASSIPRRIMKPIAHSARISPLQTHDSKQSTVCSGTSQLAQFYQRAAAEARRSQRPEEFSNGPSRIRDHASTDAKENACDALYTHRKSDKGSNNADGSDNAKDLDMSNGSDSPKLQGLDVQRFNEAVKKASNDDQGSNGTEANGIRDGSDKASNNGNGSGSSDEDAQVNGSDLNINGTEEKGSNNGSNSDQVSPRESTPVKDGRSVTEPVEKEAQKAQLYTQGAIPHDAETTWAAASLQHQQRPTQDGSMKRKPSQAEMVQQILPFTLTKDQQAAISSWAAANAHSQPQQYQLMQSLLNGLTNQSSDRKIAQGPELIDRQISSLTSNETGSNTDCNTAAGLGRSLDSHRSGPGDLHKRPSGFQPYNKRSAESMWSPPSKRVVLSKDSDQPQFREPQLFRTAKPLENLPTHGAGKVYKGLTPFGSQAAQSGQAT